jgi:type I restriction enzyme M protein
MSNVDVLQKLWGFCHTLHHDGIDYGDYIEQITYLLFLKMADERGVAIPTGCTWPTIRDKSGTDLTEHYIDVLRKLGKTDGILVLALLEGNGVESKPKARASA